MKKQPQRVLPADVFDALELSALVHGGIGGSCLTKYEDDAEVPICIQGHARFLDGQQINYLSDGPVTDALVRAFGGDVPGKDGVWEHINANDNVTPDTQLEGEKITWQAWCRRLNVVRGV